MQLLYIVRFLYHNFKFTQILIWLSDSRLKNLIIRIQILILYSFKQVFIEILLRLPRHDPHVAVPVDVEQHRVPLRIDELDVVGIWASLGAQLSELREVQVSAQVEVSACSWRLNGHFGTAIGRISLDPLAIVVRSKWVLRVPLILLDQPLLHLILSNWFFLSEASVSRVINWESCRSQCKLGELLTQNIFVLKFSFKLRLS